MSTKRTGARTSLIVDPPNGRIPPLTPEAQKIAAADREFRLALLQATETCKNKSPACSGGKYDPTPSPRRAELPPRYNTARMNRHDGPEDGALAERCLTGGLPEFGAAIGGSFRRIVQTPGGISMFYDVGQGQGWQRNIVMDGSPHLPANIRQWYGDSRGHWEGNTLVIDVTNFSPKTDFQGSRENLHLVERWTRTGPTTLEYVVTDRGSDGVDEALDRQAGVHQAERRGEPDLLRAALHRRKLRPSRDCCMDGAWKSSPSRRDAVPIREPGIASRVLSSRRIRLPAGPPTEGGRPRNRCSGAATSQAGRHVRRCGRSVAVRASCAKRRWQRIVRSSRAIPAVGNIWIGPPYWPT